MNRYWLKWRPQEVKSLVQTRRSDDPVFGKSLGESLQNLAALERSIQFTIVCEDAFFLHGVSIRLRAPACREDSPRAESYSRIYAASPERVIIGPVLQVHIMQVLGSSGIDIQISPTTTPDRKSWIVLCRGKNRFVDELRVRDPGHQLASNDSHLERSVAKEIEFCSIEVEQSYIKETCATQFLKFWRIRCTIRKKLFLLGKGGGWTFLLTNPSKETVFRHYVQDEGETDGVVHRNSMVPKLRKAFHKSGGWTLSDQDWLYHIYHGSKKIIFWYSLNSHNSLFYTRAIQGYNGGHLSDCSWVDGSCHQSMQMKRIHVSQRIFV